MKPRIRHRSGHEILRDVIPDHHEEIATMLGVGWREVYRWQAPPESNEEPLANGRRSPLDRLLDLVSAVYLHNPAGAALLVDAVVTRLDQLRQTHRRDGWDAHEALADVTATISLAIADLRDGKITDSDVKVWRKLKHLVDEGHEEICAICREGRQ